MAIHRLNHAVLYVRDVARSVAFYRRCSASRSSPRWAGGRRSCAPTARATTTTWGCSRSAPRRRRRPPGAAASGSTTWRGRSTRCEDLQRLAGALADAGALVGTSDHSTTKSLYGQDPDGLEFEIAWIVPGRPPRRRRVGRPRVDPPAGPAPAR